ESSGDGPSAFLETPSRASLIPLPRSPTPTMDDLRPEPVADWSVDAEEEEVEREGKNESEGEEVMTATDGSTEPGAAHRSEMEEKREGKWIEARSEREKGLPKGRESRRLVLREKNLSQTEGVVSARSFPPAGSARPQHRLIVRRRAPPPPQPAAAAFADEEDDGDKPPLMSKLVVVTYNIHRSPDVWAQLVNLPALWRVDVLLLQEVPRSLKPLPRGWSLVLPPPVTYTTDEPTHPRSAALVSPHFPPSAFSQLPVASRDVVGVNLRVNERKSVQVVGVYNPCAGGRSPANRSAREVLPPILTSLPPQTTLVIASDFNLHHPAWDSSVLEANDEAEEARLTFEEAGLVHLHEATEATWSSLRSSRVLDLVLGNLQAEERLVSSGVDEALEYGSDPARYAPSLPSSERSARRLTLAASSAKPSRSPSSAPSPSLPPRAQHTTLFSHRPISMRRPQPSTRSSTRLCPSPYHSPSRPVLALLIDGGAWKWRALLTKRDEHEPGRIG
ncbi:hypothetical protein NBRC10512_005918, partial [Rhodotorula toruloides]